MTDSKIKLPVGINIGVDYYPEHWDESLWVKDADMMHEAGVKIVRMAESSHGADLNRMRAILILSGLTGRLNFLRTVIYMLFCVRLLTHLHSGFLKSIRRLSRLIKREIGFPLG